MLGTIAIGLGILGLGALVSSFILDELTEDEKAKQQDLYDNYEYFSSRKEKELKDILNRFNISKEELWNSNNEKIVQARNEYFNKFQDETDEFIIKVQDLLREQLKSKLMIRDEIKVGIDRIKRMRNNQTTFLRHEAMDNLDRELHEALNRTYAYENYLKGYKSYLYPYIKRKKKIEHDFKMFSFKLPGNSPYTGKLMFMEKELLLKGEISEYVDDIVPIKYIFNEDDIIDELDNKINIPVLVSNSKFNKTTYMSEYELSAAKGYLKDISINQNRIGIEAKVKEHKILKNGTPTIILDYKGLELNLYRNNLENPKRTPPCGTTIRVYPKKWDCALRYTVEVSERYQDSLKSFQFDTLPVVLSDEEGTGFIEYVKENEVDFENNEWKIGPLKESEIPKVSELKIQFGNEILFSVRLEGDENPYFGFVEILDKKEAFLPEDIFTVMEATLTLCNEDDIEEFEEENFRNIKNLSIMLFNEFKIQKALKTSHKGMNYFNKWAEINDKLINYLEKGKSVTCEVENFSFHKKDKKSGLAVFIANIVKDDVIKEYIEEVSDKFYQEFFIEDENGDYALVEFSNTGDKLFLYGDHDDIVSKSLLTIFVKVFPYPEIQQKRALADFRSGRITNSKFQSYILDSSNIESNKGMDSINKFYNENLSENIPQKQAVIKVIEEQDIFMIQGPPGTGKTTVIREIIKQHIEKHINDRILIVSQANVAIDNVLKGMPKEFNYKIIRCGKEDKIDEVLKDISFETKYNKYIEKINSKECSSNNFGLIKWKEIINKGKGKYNSVVGELLLKSHSIVGATCVGLAQKQIGLDRIEFDLVIIDEVGKALPAEILLPLNRAKKIIMIGDHKQLPPTINPVLLDKEKIELHEIEYCKDELFEKSLFENLYENCPSSNKSILKTQYRMPAVIGTMVSECFYNAELENGDITYSYSPIYFRKNLNILDMSKDYEFREHKEGNAPITNDKEAKVVYDVVRAIRSKVGVDKRIAVISPYRRQKSVISSYLREHGINIFEENIAVNTIDAFQGEEAEIVLYCTTRSKKRTNYFSDLARLNVALSRSKNDLLIIGSLNYFRSYGNDHILNKIADYISVNGEIIEYSNVENPMDKIACTMEEKTDNSNEFVDKSNQTKKSIDESIFTFEKINNSIEDNKQFLMNINYINVSDEFKCTPPKREKIEKFIKYYLENGKLDKAISIDKNNQIKNGYARYLASLELGLEKILVELNK